MARPWIVAREIGVSAWSSGVVILCLACARTLPPEPQPHAGPPAAASTPASVATAPPRAAASSLAPPPPRPAAEPVLTARSAKLGTTDVRSPMPGGWTGGWAGDTGLDIAGDHLDVFAIAAGTLDYSERGHTRWTRGKDTAFSVRLALDQPIPWGDRKITHVYYTHLARVEHEQAEGAAERRHVQAGERIGVSGIGNGTPHLHLGLLLDGQIEQDSWTFILREHEVRAVLGNLRNGSKLP